ncbi:MAG: hypothetical protein ACD_61C00282G0003 [uncultured bacterium]|nr:MAG: hypothetical protein ACD_61C00282G0003 [uncultured bacterium]
MKKLIFILPVALFLSGCTLFPSAPITGTEEQKAEKLAQIISSGGQANCKVTNLSDGTGTQIIVSGKKMKIVGSDMGEGKQGTMINDTLYTYIWSEGEKVGYKMKVEAETPEEPTGTPAQPEQFDTNQQTADYEDTTKYKMDCTRGNVSDSEFTPPADVEFTDFADMLRSVPTMPAR